MAVASAAAATRAVATRPASEATARPPTSSVAASSPRRTSASGRDGVRVGGHHLGRGGRLGRAPGLGPRHVGREDQGGHLPGRAHGGAHGLGRVPGHLLAVARGADPPRHRAGDGLDVALQRGVEGLVGQGVVTDDVDHRRVAPSGVVEVGPAVAEAGAEVEQRGRRLAGDAGVAVGRAGDHPLEQAQHAAHLGHVVEGGDEVHLRGAGVGEADVDPAGDEGADERVGAVHGVLRDGGGVGAGRAQSSRVPGFRVPWGSKAALMRRISATLAGSVSSRKRCCFSVPMPCSPLMAPPRSSPASEHVAQDVAAHVRVGLEHRQVDVAVAGVAAARDPRARGPGDLGHLGQVLGDRRPGHHHVEDVVGVVGLGHPERLLPGVDEGGAGGGGQDVDVHGPGLTQHVGHQGDVLLHPLGGAALDHDHQVGQRRVLDLARDAEVEAHVGGGRAHGDHVDVLDDQRAHAAAHHLGHDRGDLVEGGEGGQDRGRVGQQRVEAAGDLGDQAEGALRADHQLGEVVAGGGLHDLAAGAQDLARGQHQLQAQHLVAGHAVLDRPHAAGVGGHVAAQGAAALAREHGVDEAVGGEGLVELGQGDPRLDHGDVVVGVDLEDLGHGVEGHHQAALDRDGGPGEAGARPPGGDRHPGLVGQAQRPRPPRRWSGAGPRPGGSPGWR